jgi:hypothetical protein
MAEMERPLLNIIACDRIYDPGCHNAFTDLIHWRGRIWLVFREALNHSPHASSQIVVMSSADHGKTFQTQSRFSSPGLDVRDPKFFILKEKLNIIIPCWLVPERRLVTIVASSSGGLQWEEHHVRNFDSLVVWRPRTIMEAAVHTLYAAAYFRGKPEERYVKLMRSTDGLHWDDVSIIHDKNQPNETELCFLKTGALLALVRREDAPNFPLLASNTPPYTGPWKKLECDQFLQGPLLEDLGDGRFLVVGRSPLKIEQTEKNPRVTRIFSLDVEAARLIPRLTLESGADNSYAGFVRIPTGAGMPWNALLSYYSGHGYENGNWQGGETPQRSAIFVARVNV